tara:strand:- start:18 stop:290 length:273 start_codon:yes stop_codon:yes gene_type:complete
MRKIKLFKNGKGKSLVPYVSSKGGRHEVVAPVSSVRIGETNRNAVKSKHCVDYPKWCAIYVGKSHTECKKWLDRWEKTVIKLCIPYEVSS